MLSLFPELLDWSFFAPTLLRITIAFFMLQAAREIFDLAKKEPAGENARTFPILALLLAVLAILFFTGYLLQVAAAIGFSFASIAYILRGRGTKYLTRSREFYLLVLVVCLSLIVLGAGAFAIDIPI